MTTTAKPKTYTLLLTEQELQALEQILNFAIGNSPPLVAKHLPWTHETAKRIEEFVAIELAQIAADQS